MKQFTSDIELREGLDIERLNKSFPEATEMHRMKLIESHASRRIWEWLFENDIGIKLEGMDIIQSHFNMYVSDLYIQVLINEMEDMNDFLVLFMSDPNWELYDESRDVQKRVSNDWKHGAYLRFNFSPTSEYMEFLNGEFGGKLQYADKAIKLSQYAFDVYFDFFPAENGDCAITELGEKEVTITSKVYEFTCGEGAAEMRELLNGVSE